MVCLIPFCIAGEGVINIKFMTQVTQNHFFKVTRYTTSAFLRMKLGDSLAKRGLAPHIYESKIEAHEFLKSSESHV